MFFQTKAILAVPEKDIRRLVHICEVRRIHLVGDFFDFLPLSGWHVVVSALVLGRNVGMVSHHVRKIGRDIVD